MPTTEDLARFGARTYALLALTPEWDSDIFETLKDYAQGAGLSLDDSAQARALCRQEGLDPADYGDTTPTLTAGHSNYPATLAAVQARYDEWHDATHTDASEPTTEAETAHRLIDTLCSYAGIRAQ